MQSDTAVMPRGGGTGGSRSLQLGGTAVLRATEAVLEQARIVAARLLEAAPEDIVVTDDGRLGVAGRAGVGARVGRAGASRGRRRRRRSLAELDIQQDGATFPFGAHIAVVEVDTETGRVELVRHIAVDDCGRILNPLIVAGQQHGGRRAGRGAGAVGADRVYDDDGNPLTANLMDYAMPSAAELCSFEAVNTETPSPLNPLGAKGIGESGTIGSTPAVQNAVVDALAHLGIRHVDMPCTPERVWRAIEAARAGAPPDPWREPPAFFDTLPAGRTRRPTVKTRRWIFDGDESLMANGPTITDEGLARLRERIGVAQPHPQPPHYRSPNEDAFRHLAEANGDDNPLWCEPEYATATVWGGPIASPNFNGGDTLIGENEVDAARSRDQGAAARRPDPRRARLLLRKLPRVVESACGRGCASAAATRWSASTTSRASSPSARSTSGRARCSAPSIRRSHCRAQYRLMIRTEREEAEKRGKYASHRDRALHRRRDRPDRRGVRGRAGDVDAAPNRAGGRTSRRATRSLRS